MTQITHPVPATLEWRPAESYGESRGEPGGELYLLDQTQLPFAIHYEQQTSVEQVWQSIQQLKVRGAPAIGVAAAYGLCVAVRAASRGSVEDLRTELQRQAAYLRSARPTAVNLAWALQRMLDFADQQRAVGGRELWALLVGEAQRIHAEDVAICAGIAAHGVSLIQSGSGVLTHCNAGALATTGLGTATAPLYLAHQRGVPFRVYADETRPLLQGARLTAWELQRAGIDVALLTDNMAASMMARGRVSLVIVGTDRVTANGDVVNKIGTLGVAVLAHHFGVPFYVACPSSTIDVATPTGAQVIIEERHGDEVAGFGGVRTAPAGVATCNPAFDVTPHALVSGLITEQGILRPPFAAALQRFAAVAGGLAR